MRLIFLFDQVQIAANVAVNNLVETLIKIHLLIPQETARLLTAIGQNDDAMVVFPHLASYGRDFSYNCIIVWQACWRLPIPVGRNGRSESSKPINFVVFLRDQFCGKK